MASLSLAVQANQALVLPPLLLVAYLQHVESVHPISVDFEDAAAIGDDGAVVIFDTGNGGSVADASVLRYLIEAYAFVEQGQVSAVCRKSLFNIFHQPEIRC